MAGLDYYAILEEMAAVIGAAIPEATVDIEVETLPAAELCPFVVCYFEERRENATTMAAGKRTHYELRFSVWSFGFSINSLKEAKRLSWQLLDRVERALMANRTLNQNVAALWLLGGAMDLERGSKGAFLNGAEVIVAARVVSAL